MIRFRRLYASCREDGTVDCEPKYITILTIAQRGFEEPLYAQLVAFATAVRSPEARKAFMAFLGKVKWERAAFADATRAGIAFPS